MEVVRITTAGSVDDGKSTLIGRLLYDTRSLTDDKLEAIEAASRRKGIPFTDLSLITDGLIAEREQGITIDVAYIYFSTPTRKFIIADTPGHVEYTRNMVTGASTASVFIILVDARNGITEQTRRHFFIAGLLRIQEVAVCVNKMDLVDFRPEVFDSICNEFRSIAVKASFEGQDIRFIPMVARDGDNVAEPSARMSWFSGPTLLEFLEQVKAEPEDRPDRFQVQYVIRPHARKNHDFRGYAGRVISGSFRTGDSVTVLPSGSTTKVKSLTFADTNLESASAHESVVFELEDDIDLSRGQTLIKEIDSGLDRKSLTATVCWMSESAMDPSRTWLLQHGVNRVRAKIARVVSVLNVERLDMDTTLGSVKINDIARLELRLAVPVFADAYRDNPANGCFILIDEANHNTVAGGFIE